MEYIALLNTSEFIILLRHGYIESKEIYNYSNSKELEFILLNADPFRYEFDKLILILKEKDLTFTSIKSFHPLTQGAKVKMQDDFPSITFSDPLTKIDLNSVVRFNRIKEIKEIRNYLSKIFSVQLEKHNHDLSNIQQERQNGLVNPKKRSMLETTMLFNETDNYPNTDIKYFMRLGEIYLMSQMGYDGIAFQQSEAFKKWNQVELKPKKFNQISNLIRKKGESFESKIGDIKELYSSEYFEVIPMFLKFKDSVQNNDHDSARDILKYFESEKAVCLFIELISGIYNFNVVQNIFFLFNPEHKLKPIENLKSKPILEITNEEILDKPGSKEGLTLNDNSTENNEKEKKITKLKTGKSKKPKVTVKAKKSKNSTLNKSKNSKNEIVIGGTLQMKFDQEEE